VIETAALTKVYGEKRAVDRLTLRIEPGEVMGFLGPNGSGKTTTIRLLMGLLRPTEGSASIRGRDCHRDAVALKREVGYLPDEPFLYPYLSGYESLELVAGLHGFSAREARARARGSAETFGLGEAAGTFTVTYSHGMKKRLALAMALIHEPQVLILDEPTNGLDPRGAREMRDTIARLAAGGRTVFLSTHLLEAAERICHRVAIIRAGVLQAVGTPSELREHYAAAPETSLEDLFLQVTDEAPRSREGT
jgi:ABC-2 type transport system ATP-binding protein